MGLGIVEVILAAEDRFGITISDETLLEVRTVGDLVALIVRLSSEQSAESSYCRTSRAFFRLRGILSHAPLVKRIPIKPSVGISDLVLPTHRLALWKRLRQAGIRLPGLEYPKPVTWLLGILAISCFVSLLFLFGVTVESGLSWQLALYLSPLWVGSVVLWKLADPLRNRIPTNCATLGDIATFLALDASVVGPLSAGDVMVEMRELIHRELDVPIDKITPEARLIEDLGAG